MTDRPILFSGPMVRALLDGRKTQTRRVVKGVPRGDHYGRDIMDWGLSGIHQETYDPSNPIAGTDRWHLDVQTDVDAHSRRVIRCPYGAPGDRLIVRETFRLPAEYDDLKPSLIRDDAPVWYEADPGRAEGWGKTRPSLHMPRWASRLTLTITDVRVERLQDISEADAIAEGLYKSCPDDEDRAWFRDHHEEHHGAPPSQADFEDFEAGVWMVPGVPQGWGITAAERRRDTWAPTPQFAFRLLWEHINGPGSWAANPWVWALTFAVERRNIDEARP